MRWAILLGGLLASCGGNAASSSSAPVDAALGSMTQPDDADTIPCGPRHVLQTICQRCHTNPPQNGAPFPLVRHSDIARQTPDGLVYERMIEQLEVGRMPMAPVTIDYNSRETLLDWLHAGAPQEAPHACVMSDAGSAE